MLALLFLAGCEKDFYIPEQQEGKKMVVNCVFDNYRIFRVYVTESALLSGPGAPVVLTDARVTLYEDGLLKEELKYVPTDTMGLFGSFQSTFIPQQGKKYAVTVVHPVYGTVTANDVLLKPADVSIAEVTMGPEGNPNYNSMGRIRFTDNAAEQNYYRLSIWMDWNNRYVDPGTGDTIVTHAATSSRPEMLTSFADSTRDNNYQFLFTDEGFNGQQKDLHFFFRGPDTSDIYHGTVFLELSSVSKAHYEYFRTLEVYHNSNSYGSEPVHIFNNINGGYGIFVGQSIRSMAVPIK